LISDRQQEGAGQQQGYGFKPLTEEDKAKIFGLNMARLLGIEPIKKAK